MRILIGVLIGSIFMATQMIDAATVNNKQDSLFDEDNIESLKNFTRMLTSPEHFRRILAIVKEAKLHSPAKVIKTFLGITNRHNQTEHLVIDSIKSLNRTDIEDIAGILLRIDQMLEKEFIPIPELRIATNINITDFKQLAGVNFNIFKQTNSSDLEWLIELISKQFKDGISVFKDLLMGRFGKLYEEWNNEKQHLREKIIEMIRNLKKINRIQTVTPNIPELTEIYKRVAIRVAEKGYNFLENMLGDFNIREIVNTAFKTVIDTKGLIEQGLSIVDGNELGAQVESLIKFAKTLNRNDFIEVFNTIRRALDKVAQFLKESSGLNIFVDKKVITWITHVIDKLNVPDEIRNSTIDAIIGFIDLIDGKDIRSSLENLVKTVKTTDKSVQVVNSVLQNIVINLLKDQTIDLLDALNITKLHDLNRTTVDFIESIDPLEVKTHVESFLNYLNNLNDSVVADIIISHLNLYSDFVEPKNLANFKADPIDALENFMIHDAKNIFYVFFSELKLINFTALEESCVYLASQPRSQLLEFLNNILTDIKQQFWRVDQGKEVYDNLHIERIGEILKSLVSSVNLTELCHEVKIQGDIVNRMDEYLIEELAGSIKLIVEEIKNHEEVSSILSNKYTMITTFLDTAEAIEKVLVRMGDNSYKLQLVRLIIDFLKGDLFRSTMPHTSTTIEATRLASTTVPTPTTVNVAKKAKKLLKTTFSNFIETTTASTAPVRTSSSEPSTESQDA